MSRRLVANLPALLILALLGGVMFWPLWQVLRGAVWNASQNQWTTAYLAGVWLDSSLRAGLLNSALMAVSVTVLCLLISLPLAILTTRYDFRGKGLLGALVLMPLVLPPFVGAIGMKQILGRMGALTALAQHLGILDPGQPADWMGHMRFAAIAVVEALGLYPIMYLNLAAAMANLDPSMAAAAENLGASRWTVFGKITLPLLRPGLLAGGTIVLIWSFTELGTPLMFDYYQLTAVQVFQRISQVSGSPMPYALVIWLLAVSVGLYVVSKFVLGGRGGGTSASKATVQSQTRRLRGGWALLAIVPFALVSAAALTPHVGVVLLSFSHEGSWYQSILPTRWTGAHYLTALTHDIAMPSVANSLLYAAWAMILDVAAGVAIAWILVRSRLWGWAKGALDALVMLPLAVPGLVLAFGFLAISLQLQVWFKDVALVRDWVNVQKNPMLLLIVAYALRRLPYVVRSAVAGLEQTPADLERAARNLGAGAMGTLRKITFPLIAANLLAGGLLAFSFAVLEVSDSLILAQRQSYWPITRAIYELFQRLEDGPYIAAALGVWAMVLLSLTLLGANSLLGKKMGAIFRT